MIVIGLRRRTCSRLRPKHLLPRRCNNASAKKLVRQRSNLLLTPAAGVATASSMRSGWRSRRRNLHRMNSRPSKLR